MDSGFRDLKVYQRAYVLAMEIYNLSKKFPKEETYALTDQIRRSSRAVCACLAEADRKRRYVKHFTSKISDADAEASETLVWLDFSRDSGYLSADEHDSLVDAYRKVGRMLGSMADNPERFLPRGSQDSEESYIDDINEIRNVKDPPRRPTYGFGRLKKRGSALFLAGADDHRVRQAGVSFQKHHPEIREAGDRLGVFKEIEDGIKGVGVYRVAID